MARLNSPVIDPPLTRRDARQSLATAAVAATALRPFDSSAEEPSMNDAWIDAHSHIWTRDVERFPLAKRQTVADLQPPRFTPE